MRSTSSRRSGCASKAVRLGTAAAREDLGVADAARDKVEIDADFGANPLRKIDHVFERAAAGALADDERGGFGRCSLDQAAEFGAVAGVHIDRATTRGEQRDEKSSFAQCSDLRGQRTVVEVLDAAIAAIILDHRAGENFPVTPDLDGRNRL